MNNPLVSIIVPVYNVQNSVARCLESICAQTWKNIEIILVNDGSRDESFSVCEQFREKDPRIVLVDKSNSGVSDTRNCGMTLASGKYVQFVDSDDYIEPDFTERLAQIRVTNTVDFKSKSTVFLCLSASKFIAILQILCKIKVEVHMDLVSAINFYPADKLADDHLFCFKAGTIVQVCVRDQFFVQLRYICHQFSVSLQFCTGFFTQSFQLRVLLFLCCDHLGKSVFRKSTLPFDYSQNLSF